MHMPRIDVKLVTVDGRTYFCRVLAPVEQTWQSWPQSFPRAPHRYYPLEETNYSMTKRDQAA